MVGAFLMLIYQEGIEDTFTDGRLAGSSMGFAYGFRIYKKKGSEIRCSRTIS